MSDIDGEGSERLRVSVVDGEPSDPKNPLSINDVERRLVHILSDWYGYRFDGTAFVVEDGERGQFEKRIEDVVELSSGYIEVEIERVRI